jgi:5-methylcytosine-specific restriction endonuclease McrA
MSFREQLLALVLASAREKRDGRDAYLVRLRATLRDLAAEGVQFEPFRAGTVIDQFGYELNTLRVEHGDPLAAVRRTRRNKKVSPGTRKAVYRRDLHTCVECGWRSPSDAEARRRENQSGRYLTIDHVIPLAEDGPNHITNMRTLCSICNPVKGHALPEGVPAA